MHTIPGDIKYKYHHQTFKLNKLVNKDANSINHPLGWCIKLLSAAAAISLHKLNKKAKKKTKKKSRIDNGIGVNENVTLERTKANKASLTRNMHFNIETGCKTADSSVPLS